MQIHDLSQRFARFGFYARLALRSSSPVRRLTDLIIANVLFNLPVTLRKQLFVGERAFCPLCLRICPVFSISIVPIIAGARYAAPCNGTG